MPVENYLTHKLKVKQFRWYVCASGICPSPENPETDVFVKSTDTNPHSSFALHPYWSWHSWAAGICAHILNKRFPALNVKQYLIVTPRHRLHVDNLWLDQSNIVFFFFDCLIWVIFRDLET